jgi:RimJ/RimL family protein N-acetyltransferase
MHYVIVADSDKAWRFVHEHTGIPAVSGFKGLVLERKGVVIAAVVYERYNRVNIWAHFALTPGVYVTPEFISYCFEYPFEELGCARMTAMVDVSNTAAAKLDEHLGFTREAVLTGAAADGGDTIVYVLRREDCRYIGVHDGR